MILWAGMHILHEGRPRRAGRGLIAVVIAAVLGIGGGCTSRAEEPAQASEQKVGEAKGVDPVVEPKVVAAGVAGGGGEAVVGGAVSLEECIHFGEHLGELMTQGMTRGAGKRMLLVFAGIMGDLVKACSERATRVEFECGMKAATLAAIKQCSPLAAEAAGMHVERTSEPTPALPTKEQCQRFVDHFVALTVKGVEGPALETTRKVAQDMRGELYDDCLNKGTKDQIDCALRASVLDDMGACGGGREGAQ